MTRVFLDMDGVCCDFVGGVLRLLGRREVRWPKGEYSIAKVLGVSEDELWRRIDVAGEDFWVRLVEYPWFRILYAGLHDAADGELYFLTSPSKHVSSLAGKRRWLQDRFGPFFDNVIFTRHKDLLAADDACLIDDDERNVAAFVRTGGRALVFPRPWNGAAAVADPVKHVLGWLKRGDRR